MSDFASAAMLRLIGLGMQRQGIAIPAFRPPRQAHVPLAAKHALLEQLLREHGALVLLRIGEAVRDVRDEPALTALLSARDPVDLLARWQRLERFMHSHHRITMEPPGDCSVSLSHTSLDAGEAPRAAQDLLVFGLLVALIERLGTQGLRAQFVGEARWRYRQGRWNERPLPNASSHWMLTWNAAEQASAALPTAEQDRVDCMAAGHRLLAADGGRLWTLPGLAREMKTSPRSLQRHLLASQSNFSALLQEVRMAQAAKLLVGTQQPLAEIGYVCGFSDQAHFTRVFKRQTALTPGGYRERFAASR